MIKKATYPYKGYIIKISMSDSNIYALKNGEIIFNADNESDIENMIDSTLE